ncbi:dicarboxylate/amino acid:cation symporter [Rickettsiales endosymbiont of Paramecium tredecaurelia]|uniref:dicarboxylate/amino acid:cation symporter n=1 Tax=Candidatus Sarmatiella mevalonica TaxID=2770581 RepID=UPI00192513B6|nr:dicarboxylate/amino acid:cation symporter [Candidatus Sarmatiella mevalonica]MBL3285087.1 dicarboxylate/amino acid:cation symporter [Candidatus Sarmatiella mevalonica]
MCINHNSSLFFKGIKTSHLYLIAIVFSILSSYLNIVSLIELAQVITDNFIKIFKCVSLPIISLSIIVTLSRFRGDDSIKKVWQQTMLYTAGTTIMAASVTCVLYYVISPNNLSLASMVNTTHAIGAQEANYFGYVSTIIPSNVLSPFIEHHVMGVLLISIIVGLSIAFIPEEDPRNVISNFFKGAHGIFIVITSWIVKMIPIALFGFITTTLVQLKSGMDITELTKYLLVVVLANVVQGFIVLPIFLYMNNIKPFKAMQGMLPALSVAFFSKSSAGTLPITMNVIEENLSVSPRISRLVLPLCTAINMNGCAAFIFATVIYLMQNHGLEISFITMITWIFISTIAAIGNAGVPMGCFFLSASLLTSMNIPIEILGLILPFYSVIDMIETSLNVWSDACVTKVLDQKVSNNAS